MIGTMTIIITTATTTTTTTTTLTTVLRKPVCTAFSRSSCDTTSVAVGFTLSSLVGSRGLWPFLVTHGCSWNDQGVLVWGRGEASGVRGKKVDTDQGSDDDDDDDDG